MFVFTYQIFKETNKHPSIYNGTVIVAFKELTDSVLSVFTYWIFKETKQASFSDYCTVFTRILLFILKRKMVHEMSVIMLTLKQ